MDSRSMSKYRSGAASGEVRGTNLNQLLEQEGQPCSYCIAVYLMRAGGERLSEKDSKAYGSHLVWEHGARPYFVEP